MNCLLQRVRYAKVEVADKVIGQIDYGLLVFVGIQQYDNENMAKRMAHKILHYRIFSDDDHKMNRNVQESQGDILLVSQFTLAADTRKGNRPGFSTAAAPELSEPLYECLAEEMTQLYKAPETGQFGADMQVSLCNDGPVSFVLNL